MELAAGLFGYAAEQGDHNALYTYAQLLRTGGNHEYQSIFNSYTESCYYQDRVWELISPKLLIYSLISP